MKIAFGCKQRSGKDTAADYLISKHSGMKLSFANPLYEILRHVQNKLGFSIEKDRKFMQFIGTEWARDKDPDVFINILLKELGFCEDAHNCDLYSFFVTDVRFPNEFKALKDNGFYMVKVHRPCGSELLEEHSSEMSLDSLPEEEWNAVVVNDGSLQDYYDKLDHLWAHISDSTTSH
jgi:hypothetical protein